MIEVQLFEAGMLVDFEGDRWLITEVRGDHTLDLLRADGNKATTAWMSEYEHVHVVEKSIVVNSVLTEIEKLQFESDTVVDLEDQRWTVLWRKDALINLTHADGSVFVAAYLPRCDQVRIVQRLTSSLTLESLIQDFQRDILWAIGMLPDPQPIREVMRVKFSPQSAPIKARLLSSLTTQQRDAVDRVRKSLIKSKK